MAINFAKGHPPSELLPNGMLARAFQDVTNILLSNSQKDASPILPPEVQAQPNLLQYCAGRGAAGYRKKLAHFISRQANDGVSAHNSMLMTTNGVSHGLDLVASSLALPGDTVLVENPCYFLASSIFRDHHLTVVPLDLRRAVAATGNSNGSANDEVVNFEALLDAHPRCKLVYLVPTNCNPTGRTMSSPERAALVAAAARRGVVVVADEVYHFLDWKPQGERPARMVAYDAAFLSHLSKTTDAPYDESQTSSAQSLTKDTGRRDGRSGSGDSDDDDDGVYASPVEPPKRRKGNDTEAAGRGGGIGNVVSVGSFTKICSPGLRLGWLEASPGLLELISNGYIQSGGGVAPLQEAVMATLLNPLPESGTAEESPLDRHIARLRTSYASRASALVKALESFPSAFPEIAEVPSGGFFCWVRLKSGVDAETLAAVAETSHGVSFLPGVRCHPNASTDSQVLQKEAGELHAWVRLCFAMLSEDAIHEGVKRLAEAVESSAGVQKDP